MSNSQLLRMKQGMQEGFVLLLAATLLGFAYTAVVKKGLFTLTAASVPTATPQKTVAPVFISYEEAVGLLNSGDALFVDARHEFDYKTGHIKGAINVPLTDFSLEHSLLVDVSKEKLIVTYCDGAECNSSIELAKKLSEAGFTKVKMFFGGWTEWQQHQNETER